MCGIYLVKQEIYPGFQLWGVRPILSLAAVSKLCHAIMLITFYADG